MIFIREKFLIFNFGLFFEPFGLVTSRPVTRPDELDAGTGILVTETDEMDAMVDEKESF